MIVYQINFRKIKRIHQAKITRERGWNNFLPFLSWVASLLHRIAEIRKIHRDSRNWRGMKRRVTLFLDLPMLFFLLFVARVNAFQLITGRTLFSFFRLDSLSSSFHSRSPPLLLLLLFHLPRCFYAPFFPFTLFFVISFLSFSFRKREG